jgi:glutathione synthase/RimK-type ligase-like ATP-grasp enzyme
VSPKGGHRVSLMQASAAVALATCARFPDLTPDDRLLVRALGARGVSAEAAVWDSPSARWETYDAIVIRSCWDYHLRFPQFLAWVDQVERAGVTLWNPATLLRWNADKIYLRDLAARGVDVVPTHWVDQGEATPLARLMAWRGWEDAVVKPSVSASAHETRRLNRAAARAEEPWFRSLVEGGRALIQPFLPEVQSKGEWSLIFIGGRFSHAALKRPAPGDFRVQAELGGTHEPAPPDRSVLDAAARIVELTPEPSLYARVDGCVVAGRFMLMELELLEPVLFLAQAPEAVDWLAEEIASRLGNPEKPPGQPDS